MQDLHHVLTGTTLYHTAHDMPSGLYRMLVPAGTRLWRVSVQTYLYPAPARALLAFDAPPVAPGTPNGSDTLHTLSRLWAGETISFDAPANSGGMSISQPSNDDTFRADRDRWLYLQLDFPGGLVNSWQSWLELHADQVPTPAPQPTPSPELAQRALAYAQHSGLVEALRRTAGAQTDNELIDWVNRQPDLWFSICRMVELASKEAL